MDNQLPNVLQPPIADKTTNTTAAAAASAMYIKRGPGRPRKSDDGCSKNPKSIHFSSHKQIRKSLSGYGSSSLISGGSGGIHRGIRGRKKADSSHFIAAGIKGGNFSGSELSLIGQSGADSPPRNNDDTAADTSDTSSVSSSLEKLYDDFSFFPEQWPGKLCALCNLGERTMLGQGELLKIETPSGFDPITASKEMITVAKAAIDKENLNDKSPKTNFSARRLKGIGKMKRLLSQGSLESMNEPVDEIVGHGDEPDLSSIFEAGQYYVHQACALWCREVKRKADGSFENLEVKIIQALNRRCNYCGNLGAGLLCKALKCSSNFHFPCAAMSGTFQDPITQTMFCSNHLDQAFSDLATNLENICTVCADSDNQGNHATLLMCCSCGHHFHSSCMALNPDPNIRAGWQCPACKVCQACRQAGDETKLLACDTCDKSYHIFCLRPALSSIPKHSWKCKLCRVCTDCGARTPGSGPSSRWHANFSVCDSCYQQRNKGLACPLCGKAYRHVAQKLMLQCHLCKKYVHGTCDPSADLSTYENRKIIYPDYEYNCLPCKAAGTGLNTSGGNPRVLLAIKRDKEDYINLFAEDSISFSNNFALSQDSFPGEDDSLLGLLEAVEPPDPQIKKTSIIDGQSNTINNQISTPTERPNLGKLDLVVSENGKKKIGVGRPKSLDKAFANINNNGRKPRISEILGKKRGPKPKMRGIFEDSLISLQRHLGKSRAEDEPGVENRLVLCSSKDDFVLNQDVCVMCGAYGNDMEGRLISCSQCGQCYHPFCVNIKVTKVVLQKGWRCLDCTVCEGCGQRNDEARLILCDDCDISFHIYCMEPPLDLVPQGTWKCKWCAICQLCGANYPGKNDTWHNNFTRCGPCTSMTICPVCNLAYINDVLIVQCQDCARWIHASCDQIKTEEDAETCANLGYQCVLCRPSELLPVHLRPPPPPIHPDELFKRRDKMRSSFIIDGILLSEKGISKIKSQMLEQPKKKRKKMPNFTDMEAGIMAAIESVVSGGMIYSEDRLEDFKFDGKKRHRNIQKLGVGGFLVRIRGPRLKDEEYESSELMGDSDKKRKAPRRKNRNKLTESFPTYLQEAFFGKTMDNQFKFELYSATDENIDIITSQNSENTTINLSTEELKALDDIKSRQEEDKIVSKIKIIKSLENEISIEIPKNEQKKISGMPFSKIDIDDDGETLNDILPLTGDILDNDFVDTIMDEEELNSGGLDDLSNVANIEESESTTSQSTIEHTQKDELSEFLNAQFNLETSLPSMQDLPSMDSKDVEDIFKGVLTDESQESQDNFFPSLISTNANGSSHIQPLLNQKQVSTNLPIVLTSGNVMQNNSPGIQNRSSIHQNVQQNLSSPLNFPSPSPYQDSPQFSPAFSEPPSPWTSHSDADGEQASNYNQQRSILKWEVDEALCQNATISAVLYANSWAERSKQIAKIWRGLAADKRAPYLQKARENRAASRMHKTQTGMPNECSTGSSSSGGSKKSGFAGIVQIHQPNKLQSAYNNNINITIEESVEYQEVTHKGKAVCIPNISNFGHSKNTCDTTSPTHANSLFYPNVKKDSLFEIEGMGTEDALMYPKNSNFAVGEQPIRVLTPSEIMRTLPTLSQSSTLNSSDQEKGSVSISQNQPSNPPSVSLSQTSTITTPKGQRVETQEEKHWKQMQAIRQQQSQQQQIVLQEHRLQHHQTDLSNKEPANIGTTLKLQYSNNIMMNRQQNINEPDKNILTIPEKSQQVHNRQPLLISTTQEHTTLPHSSQSPTLRQSPILNHSNVRLRMEMPPPTSVSPTSNFPLPRPISLSSTRPPNFPRIPQMPPQRQKQPNTETYQNANNNDPYTFGPSTPRPTSSEGLELYGEQKLLASHNTIGNERFNTQINNSSGTNISQQIGSQQQQGGQETKQHLRDLLQRQQIKKLEQEQISSGSTEFQTPTRSSTWNQGIDQQQQNRLQDSSFTVQHDISPKSIQLQQTQFRQPYMPGQTRLPPPSQYTQNNFQTPNKSQITTDQRDYRMPNNNILDPNQNIPKTIVMEQRMRLMLQQQQQSTSQQLQTLTPLRSVSIPFGQQFKSTEGTSSNSLDPYNHMAVHQNRNSTMQSIPQGSMLAQQLVRPLGNSTQEFNSVESSMSTDSKEANDHQTELPESVTAELEKLEQEQHIEGAAVEAEASELLSDLIVDDDELLGMGADFNILEYADPELDQVVGGEKTNILDNLDLEEEKVEDKELKKKGEVEKTKVELQKRCKQRESVSFANKGKKHLQSTSTTISEKSIQMNKSNSGKNQIITSSQSQNTLKTAISNTIDATPMRPPPPYSNNNSNSGVSSNPYGKALQQKESGMLNIFRSEESIYTVSNNLSQDKHQTIGPPPPYPGRQQHNVNTTLSGHSLSGIRNNFGGGTLQMVNITGNINIKKDQKVGMDIQHQNTQQFNSQQLNTNQHRRAPILLQEQPLLLEELLEQEKREQLRQGTNVLGPGSNNVPEEPLLSDFEFERLKADVFSSSNVPAVSLSPPSQSMLPLSSIQKHNYSARMLNPTNHQQQGIIYSTTGPGPHQQKMVTHQQHGMIVGMSNQMQNQPIRQNFTMTSQPPPPIPPEHPSTDHERQMQFQYEQWIYNQQNFLSNQLKHYETEVNKLRKGKKSLNSKQRQLRKNGGELIDSDAMELDRITRELTGLQKQLDQSRKQSRQHSLLQSDYNTKQQKRQQQQFPSSSTPTSGQQMSSSAPLIHSPSMNMNPIGHQHSPIMGQHPQSPMTSPVSAPSPGGSRASQPQMSGHIQHMEEQPFSPPIVIQSPQMRPPNSPMNPTASPSSGMRMNSPVMQQQSQPTPAQQQPLMGIRGNMAIHHQQQQSKPIMVYNHMENMQRGVRVMLNPSDQMRMMNQQQQRVGMSQDINSIRTRMHSPVGGTVNYQQQLNQQSVQQQHYPQQSFPTIRIPINQQGVGGLGTTRSPTPLPGSLCGGMGSPGGIGSNSNRNSPGSSPMRRLSGSGGLGGCSPLGSGPERPQSADLVNPPLTPRSGGSGPHTPMSQNEMVAANTHIIGHHHQMVQQQHHTMHGGDQQHYGNVMESLPQQISLNQSEQNSTYVNLQSYKPMHQQQHQQPSGGGGGNSQLIPYTNPDFSWFKGINNIGLKGGSPISVFNDTVQISSAASSTQNANVTNNFEDSLVQNNPQMNIILDLETPNIQRTSQSTVSISAYNTLNLVSLSSTSSSNVESPSTSTIVNSINNPVGNAFNKLNVNEDIKSADSCENHINDHLGHLQHSLLMKHTNQDLVFDNKKKDQSSDSTPANEFVQMDIYKQPQVGKSEQVIIIDEEKEESSHIISSNEIIKDSTKVEKIVNFHHQDPQPIVSLNMATDQIETTSFNNANVENSEIGLNNANVQNAMITPFKEASYSITTTVSSIDILVTPTTSMSTATLQSDSQNALLKQLLQNTACASMSQITNPEPTGFSLSTLQPKTINLPSRLSDSATRIPQPTPIKNAGLIQQQINVPHEDIDEIDMPKLITSVPSEKPNLTMETTAMDKPIMTNIPSSLSVISLKPENQQHIAELEKIDTSIHLSSIDGKIDIEKNQEKNQENRVQIKELDQEKEECPKKDLFSNSLRETIENVASAFLDPNTVYESKGKLDEESKKIKRRQYQAKRRQSLGKEPTSPKKRIKKASKIETDDIESYIENVMIQLKTLPTVGIVEPDLGRSFHSCIIQGAGDFSKLNQTDYDTVTGDLEGTFGDSIIPNGTDFYQTKPFGDLFFKPPSKPPFANRGFYYQEFSSPKVYALPIDKHYSDLHSPTPNRDFHESDSPDTIISSSSPEFFEENNNQFSLESIYPGLKFINRVEKFNVDEDENMYIEKENLKFNYSKVDLFAPVPIRPRMVNCIAEDIQLKRKFGEEDIDQENQDLGKNALLIKRGQMSPLKETGNVSVTVTMNTVENIEGILNNLASLLHIPPHKMYKVIEPGISQLISKELNDSKSKKYFTHTNEYDIQNIQSVQSILNGTAKFCRHCDVLIINSIIKKRSSDFPPGLLSVAFDSPTNSDANDIYFCSSACLIQFSLNLGNLPTEQAGVVVNHPGESKRSKNDSLDEKLYKNKKTIFATNEVGKMFIKPLSDESSSTVKEEINGQKWKGIKYKKWTPNPQPLVKYKKPTDKELTELLFRSAITVTPIKIPEDTRKCMFCQQIGDGVSDGSGRLLNFDVDKWVHLNCALWSDDVYETESGALVNVETALKQSLTLCCDYCKVMGATVKCFKVRCSSVYHLACGLKDGVTFYKNKTVFCSSHIPKGEKENELATLSVIRRVYIQRDENRQVAAVMHHADQYHLLRVGSLIFLSVGQLLPHQLHAFHTPHYIYPVGYKIMRFYWSMKRAAKRCQYICSIHEVEGRPEFRIQPQEEGLEDVILKSVSAYGAWAQVLAKIGKLRSDANLVKIFPQYITGEDLFGLTEPTIVKVLESLPGIDSLSDYHFKYGRNPLLELPLAINPTGCARSEPFLRQQFKKPHTQRTTGGTRTTSSHFISSSEAACPYSKQFVHSKSSQYKKMKQEWRNNVFLARSKIQGLGLYAARDIEKHTMVIEYIGEIIRSELCELREKKYEAQNRGIYMFRVDDDRVIDATLSGGLARYINHSCNPNCVAETVEVDRDHRIIIFANRRINRGEELAYDYKFEVEDDQHKISCLCLALNCRQWMN